MKTRKLGRTDIEVTEICLGTMTWGKQNTEADGHQQMDYAIEQGINFFDTAEMYAVPPDATTYGKTEEIIGTWFKKTGKRQDIILASKVAGGGRPWVRGGRGIDAPSVREAVEGSLRRLQTDYIDLYQSHWPDENVPQEETLRAHDSLIKAGKVRYIGTSNFDETLLTEALEISRREGLARYETIQNEFNLYARGKFEGPVQDICVREEISGIHYAGLAQGFLSGKYRSAADAGKSPRGGGIVGKYLNPRGMHILAALDAIAARTGFAHAEIALAWVAAQPAVAAPIASATSVAQIESLARGARLVLNEVELQQLTEAGK